MMRITFLILAIIFLSYHANQAQNIVWETIFTEGWSQQTITDLEVLDNGNILAVGGGSTGLLGQRYLFLFDSLGNKLWSKNVEVDALNRSGIGFLQAIPSDTNFYIGGYSSSIGINHNFLAKITPNGDTIWTRKYSYPAFYGTISAIAVLKDQSIVTCGYVALNNDENVIARRVDSLGNTLWESIYQMPGAQRGSGIAEMLDGSLVIAGSSDGDNLIMRIGFDGRLIQDTTFQALRTVTGFIRSFISISINNQLVLTSNFSNSNWLEGDYYIISEDFNILNTNSTNHWLRSGTSILDNSEYLITRAPDIDSMLATKYILPFQKQYDLVLSYQNPRSNVFTQLSINDDIIVAGVQIQSGQNYWLAKIDGVGNEWIPDRCAFSPPVAGFEQGFTGNGILTFRDTSYAGLKYLDTVYTWEWSSSIGQGGTDSTFTMLIDTTSTTNLDVELVISNWYGCTDTISKSFTYQTGVGLVEDIKRSIELWPNPARDVLNIRLSHFTAQQDFRLYDVQGREQLRTTITSNEAQIPISKLPSGLYFYQLSGDGFNERGKVVKE